MAITINLGEVEGKISRTESQLIPPAAVVVDWSKNTRVMTESAVDALAADMEANGQIQEITCRQLPDKRVEVISGFHRLAAALKIARHNPEFRIRVRVVMLNETEAFFHSVRENALRNATTPIDDAKNIRRMVETYGKTLDEVGAFYGRTRQWAGSTLKLTTLSPKVQDKVARGELTIQAALQLSCLGDDEADAVLDEAVNGDGVSTRKAVSKRVAAAAREKGAKGGHSLAELRKVLKGRDDAVSKTVLAYLAGDKSEKVLTRVLNEAAEAVANAAGV